MVRLHFRDRSGDTGKPLGAGGKFGLTLFFALFLTMGSLFEVFIVREFGRAMGQRRWKKVPCRIVSSEVRERSDCEKPFVFSVGYEYSFGGRTHKGSAYKWGYCGSEKYSQAQNLVQKFPPRHSTYCFVNPKRPGQVVLKRKSALVGLMVFFPLIFVLVGAGGIYFVWRKQPPPETRPIATQAIRTRGRSKYAVAAFFGVFAIVGLAILYPLGIRPISKTIDAESWVATPCKVLRAEVKSHDGEDGTTYSVYILYAYEFDGRTYKCDRYDFVGGSSSGYRGKARVVAGYEAAANPVCYVNPQRPSEATLKRGWHPKLLLALFPLPFVLIGVVGAVQTLRGKKLLPTTEARSWIPQERAAPRTDLSILRATDDDGAVVLRPKYTARAKLVGAILIAAFWNGIVSLFLAEFVGSFRRGRPDWLQGLVMLPFVAIGLGLVALVVYQLLATFNPRPTLKLSSARIPLGGVAELQWSFSGRTNRIGQFTVTLRGIEQATYRRGTNTHTDRSTFYEMELYKTSDTSEIGSGQVGLIVPSDTMHSFEAENNQIVWNLDIHGDIRRWPDVKESFRITVMPAVA